MMLRLFQNTSSAIAIFIFCVNQKKKSRKQKKMSQSMADQNAKIKDKPKGNKKGHKKKRSTNHKVKLHQLTAK